MRIFSFIMTVLLLAISFMPCRDGQLVFKEDQVELSAQHHDDGEHNEDACSPFCVCACCSLQSVHTTTLYFNAVTGVLVAEYALPVNSAIQELSRPIWQPPQLAV